MALSTVSLGGGTDVPFAPPAAYLQHVLQPTLKRLLGSDVSVTVRPDLLLILLIVEVPCCP